MFIHQKHSWPNFTWDSSHLIHMISRIRLLQGEINGKLASLGFELKDSATIESLSLEIVKSNAIEGEVLNREDVRSSIARHLGVKWKKGNRDRHIDGLVDMMMDATTKADEALTESRLFGWHAALFPTGYSGIHKIQVGEYRNTEQGQMIVESGSMNRPIVHFEAPNDERVKIEMTQFLNWFNNDLSIEPLIKSGIAHLWFITIHPFEDGNGRIARTIADLQLMRSNGTKFSYYSISDQFEKNRSQYYTMLENTQRGDLDITKWLVWYLEQVEAAIIRSKDLLKNTMKKSEFWLSHTELKLNVRQRLMINRLFDGFEGKLSTSKWAKICKCSEDSALRDISQLLNEGVLMKGKGGGRSSYYYLTAMGDSYDQIRTS